MIPTTTMLMTAAAVPPLQTRRCRRVAAAQVVEEIAVDDRLLPVVPWLEHVCVVVWFVCPVVVVVVHITVDFT